MWTTATGLDVTSAFLGITTPVRELYDEIHKRGWEVKKLDIKDGSYLASADNPHGESAEATGPTDATALGNLLVKIMRQEYMRSSALKVGMWDTTFEGQLEEIAKAYAEAALYEPKAAPAWVELAQDCMNRADTLRTQLAVEYVNDPSPYKTADEMREDVIEHQHIYVTKANAHHPLWSVEQMLAYRLVHDVLGHCVGGGDWGWHGECLACAAHFPLLSESAQQALFTEALGQTAFGTIYQQWGPQKIAFLENIVREAQDKENSDGHTPVHPSQSLAPTQIPKIEVQSSASPQLYLGAEYWKPGYFGRGLIAPDGKVDIWPEEEAEHAQWAQLDGLDPTQCIMFLIGPDGLLSGFFRTNVYGTEQLPDDESDGLEAALTRLNPKLIPFTQRTGATTIATQDPNANWSSMIDPLPDNAFLWQRDPQTGVDPLDYQGVSDTARSLDTGLANMPYPLARQSVANAFRGALLAPRKNMRANALHYQQLMGVPAEVDDPVTYWDTLEQQREHHNQSLGYAQGAHQNFWPELQQFKRWVKSLNPDLDDREVTQQSKRELLHMLTEEEERVLKKDPDEQMPANEVEGLTFDAIQRRLKALTKPKADQKVDFGDTYLWHQAHYTSDMYPPYLVSHLRPMAGIGRASNLLTDAALEDVRQHGGTGHHFRSKAMSLGLPGVTPQMASLAWLHLNPHGSQLGVMNPQITEALGHDWPVNNRDFFKYERELAAARDASGYVHMPLGQFIWGLWDNIAKGPGQHTNLDALRVHNPVPESHVDWTGETAPNENWQEPYWWQQTQEARDQVAKDWDRHIAVNFANDEIPWQPRTAKTSANSLLRPYLIHPDTGEEIEGEPGLSLMHHIKQTLGVPSVTDVWSQDLDGVGKR